MRCLGFFYRENVRKNVVLATLVTFVLVLVSALTPMASATTKEGSNPYRLQFVGSISWSGNITSHPIPPGETRIIPVNISTIVSRGSFLGKWILIVLSGKPFPVTLEVANKSEWLNASFDHTELTSYITDMTPYVNSVNLTVTVHPDAPPYGLGSIWLHLSIKSYKGPFGILTLINGYNAESILDVIAGG